MFVLARFDAVSTGIVVYDLVYQLIHELSRIPGMAKDKVEIRIEDMRGNLRLRWTHERKRYCLSLGLQDNATNRALAQMKVADIEQDIKYGMFDPTLFKYRSGKHGNTPIKVYELFERHIEFKSKKLAKQSLDKYYGTLSNLKTYFRERYAGNLTESDCEKFKSWLSEKLAPITLKQYLSAIKSAWEWAIARKMITENPWVEIVKNLPRGKVKKPQPFTVEEVQRIIQHFRTHPEYSYYADYAEFLLCTGCRIEEAIALTWGDVTEDCSQIWFGKAYNRGDLRQIKAGEAGFVPLSKSLQQMLLRRRAINVKPESLIFPSPRKGGYMDNANFRNRAWKTVLSELTIPYRKPNTSRHTLISYWLKQGEDPATVAKYTRTSLKMIFEHYGHYIPSKATLPDILGEILPPTSGGDGSGV
ncbi:MAG: phage integrase SAM-like domain-containing protein [Leptolyngbya sp. UWPOB_LEPTO1]|uniref:tyrosine-type recombinase/integrase n=1 Tax=Leptolyngbya sp. UWPOB_LEPTO1 TaxID=2815653 RepID=UPI001ACDDECF|nr:tyrosine-type recombinase/integrase [Leptolyngbya sp. UWPOB_LEPTO1]MBN8564118.1 phage integrase SAM-like domain-containing protein [Leptolyngbya sp. UWPOB_LEPTO1]